jgi:uncharacterized membrane protein YagU involved in acid resistance
MMDAKRLTAGALGGLVGGVVFGTMMHVSGMLTMVAGLVGQDSLATGWLVHLTISAVLGLGFAAALGSAATSLARALAFGLLYGAVWWVLGALLLMPARMGMPVFEVGALQVQSLVGHLLYGAALGVSYQALVVSMRGQGAPRAQTS